MALAGKHNVGKADLMRKMAWQRMINANPRQPPNSGAD